MRTVVVASATAISAGTGASWSVKWSGIVTVEYPRSSMRRACSTQPAASGGPDSWTPKRNGRGSERSRRRTYRRTPNCTERSARAGRSLSAERVVAGCPDRRRGSR